MSEFAGEIAVEAPKIIDDKKSESVSEIPTKLITETVIASDDIQPTSPDIAISASDAIAILPEALLDTDDTPPSLSDAKLEELAFVAADDCDINEVIDDFDKVVKLSADEYQERGSYNELQQIQSVQSHLSAGKCFHTDRN